MDRRFPLTSAIVLLLAACTSNLRFGTVAEVSCHDDSQCPRPRLCQTRIAQCVAALDDAPPHVTSARSIDAHSVSLAVDEPLVLAPENFVVTSASETLPLFAITAAADGLTWTLSTDAQTPGVLYHLANSGGTDAQGNALLCDGITFVGFGGLASTAPPQAVVPAMDARIVLGQNTTIDLVWEAVPGASLYTVEVSEQPDFALLTWSSALPRQQTSTSFTPPDSKTYYWRVRADVTAPGGYGGGRISVIADTLYVFCAAAADCSAGAGLEQGDKSLPFRSIARAQIVASAFGISTILVAQRDDAGTPYDDAVGWFDGMQLRGGYDASFSARHGRTAVKHETTVLRIGAATRAVLVEGFTLLATPSASTPLPSQQLVTVAIEGASADVTLRDVGIETEAGPGNAMGLVAETRANATVRVTAASQIHVRAAREQAMGIVLAAGCAMQIDAESAVDVEAVTNTSGALIDAAVYINLGAALDSAHAHFRASPQAVTGVVLNAGTLRMQDSDVAVNPGWTGGPGVVSLGPVLALVRNRIRTSDATTSAFGISLLGDNFDVTIADNVIVSVGGASPSGGIIMSGTLIPTIAGNTILAQGNAARGIFIERGSPVLTNNIIACAGAGTGVDEYSNGSITDPASFIANTIVECPVPYRNESDGDERTTATQIDALDHGPITDLGCAGCEHSRFSDTAVVASAHAFFNAGVASDGTVDAAADFIPTASAPTGQSAANTCGSVETPRSCGVNATDITGAVRTSPPTRGAWSAP